MLLEVKNVSKKYQQNGREFLAVNDVSLKVEKGELIAVCGHSGSGKSTLFHLISGLLKPEKGQILFENKDIIGKKDKEMAEYRNSEIGYILQGQSVLKNFTVIENVCLPFYVSKNKKDRYDKAMELLKTVGLEKYAETYPDQLSGGEMRRIAIARALINHPKLIIADEPTSNLDAENAVYIMELLKQISEEGIGVIFSSHDNIYEDYTDKVLTMKEGVLSVG